MLLKHGVADKNDLGGLMPPGVKKAVNVWYNSWLI